VVLKTTTANEAALFADFDTAYSTAERLEKMVRVIPTHFILGSRKDFWYEFIFKRMQSEVAKAV
jgi:hypothetical protein